MIHFSRLALTAAVLTIALLPGAAWATDGPFTAAGDPIGSSEPPTPPADDSRALGDILNSFPTPPADAYGLTFRNGNLWGVNFSGGLTEMNPDTGAVISTLTVSPSISSAGLGWDASRSVFVITDASNDVIVIADTSGNVVNSFTAPGTGPVGASWDSTRDGYWISDWEADQIDLIDPTTGAVIFTCPSLPTGSSRIVGAGYAPATDRLVYDSRDNGMTYIIEASDCSLVASFASPGNYATGCTVRPSDYTMYIRDWYNNLIVQVDSGGLLPVELTSFTIE